MTHDYPVGVRISDGYTDRHVTADISGLKWKLTASGGYHSASFTLYLDPAIFTDLGPADRMWVYDATTARTLYEGFLDNPGRIAADGGTVAIEISSAGTTVLASDESRPLIYVTRDLGDWEPYAKHIRSAMASTSDDPDEVSTEPGLLVQFGAAVVAPGQVAQIGYSRLADAGMEFGAISASVKAGKTDTGYRYELAWSPPSSSAVVVSGTGISTSIGSMTRIVGEAGHPPAGVTAVALRLKRTGAGTNVDDDDTWAWWHDVAVLGRRMNRDGVLVTGAAGMQSGEAVRADWVAEDLVGRLLTVCDPNAVTIEAASYLIDQLAFTDPVSAADVLDELSKFEPDFLWEILHSTPAGYVFNYRAWPTTARYEISTADGYRETGGDFDLCNRVAVKYTDAKGKDQTTVVTAGSAPGVVVGGVTATVFGASLKALEDAGRIRDVESITLPEGRGSAANAQRLGEQVLAAKVDPPRAATATVTRPIPDLLRGGVASYYEVEAGYLARVRETGALLRITEVDVDIDDQSVVLTLGQPVLTNEQRIAQLARVKS